MTHSYTLFPSATSATIWAIILQDTFGRVFHRSTPQGDGIDDVAAAAVIDNGCCSHPPPPDAHAVRQGVCEVLCSQCWRRHSVCPAQIYHLLFASYRLAQNFHLLMFYAGRYWRRLQRSKWPLQSFTGVSYRDAAAAINSDRVRVLCAASALTPFFIIEIYMHTQVNA